MNRRNFIKWTSVAGIAATGRKILADSIDRPNLLIIQTDEHNFRTLGCYRETLPDELANMWGASVVETPNIDEIAKAGALCTRFYATSPVCTPSRGAFVSGQYPQNNGAYANDRPLKDTVVTFAERLRENGYKTGYSGKWHLDGGAKPGWQPARSFGFEDNRYMFNRGHWKSLRDTGLGPRVGQINGVDSYDKVGGKKRFTTDWLANKTIKFITDHKEKYELKPFCYMVTIPDPHGPDVCREPYESMYDDQQYVLPKSAKPGQKNLPSWGKMDARVEFDQSKYYGMVKCIDDNIGKIDAALEGLGILHKTIVVFTSDHGDMRGEHGRKNKGIPYEASAKIPFIIRWPKKIQPGIIRESLGCVDFLPSILSLMGISLSGKEEGRDASILFRTGNAPASWKDITFFRGTGKPGENWIAAVTKRYKVVYSVDSTDVPWFFDLEEDPDEMVNNYETPRYRRIIRDMARDLINYANTYDDSHITGSSKILKELNTAAYDPDDIDQDYISDKWEQQNFQSQDAVPDADDDGDHLTNLEEFIAGTDPQSPSSTFKITKVEPRPNESGYIVKWNSVSNRVYRVQRADSLKEGLFSTLKENIKYPQNSYTDTNGTSSAYYKVDVRREDE